MIDIVGGVTAAIAAAKQLNDIMKGVKDATAKLALAELQTKLAEALTQAAEVKIELAELKMENSRLSAELEKASAAPEVFVKDGLYRTADDDGPFCTSCYDTSRRLVRVAEQKGLLAKEFGRWRCGACNANYLGTPAR